MRQLIHDDTWFLTSDCPEALNSIPVLSHDENRPEDVEKTTDKSDDVADALRYGLKSMLRPRNKPFDDVLQEKMEQIPDYTARNMVYMAEMAKRKGKERWRRQDIGWGL